MDNQKVIRITSPDCLRIIASFAVVLWHVTAIYYNEHDASDIHWKFGLGIHVLTGWKNPIFVMLTGFFLLDESHPMNVKTIFTAKLPRLFISYVIWSCIYYCQYKIIWHDTSKVYTVFRDRGYWQLWYLPMLISLYLILPIFRLIVSNYELSLYYLLLWFISTIILPTLQDFPTTRIIAYRIRKFVPSLVPYTGYLLLGNLLRRFSGNSLMKYACYLGSVLGSLYSYIIPSLKASWKLDYKYSWSNFSLGVFCQAIGIFFFFINNPNYGSRFPHITRVVSRRTFGIYLTHTFFLNFLLISPRRFKMMNPFIVIIVASVTWGLSFTFSTLLEQFPFHHLFI